MGKVCPGEASCQRLVRDLCLHSVLGFLAKIRPFAAALPGEDQVPLSLILLGYWVNSLSLETPFASLFSPEYLLASTKCSDARKLRHPSKPAGPKLRTRVPPIPTRMLSAAPKSRSIQPGAFLYSSEERTPNAVVWGSKYEIETDTHRVK